MVLNSQQVTGLSDKDLSETQVAALTHAQRRCGFVSLNKKIRFKDGVERVFALRDAEKWNALLSGDDGPSLIREQLDNIVAQLPMDERAMRALGNAVDWGSCFDRLQSEMDDRPEDVAAVAAVAAIP